MVTADPRSRWFHLTPDWLLLALLVVEALLWLSERLHWFRFNEKKGWTVLIVVASVGVTMFLMILWFIVSLLFRWRFQFSIRSLLVLVVVVAIPCSWLAVEMKKARKQREAVEAIVKLGGGVRYGWGRDAAGNWIERSPQAPAWRHDLLGVHFFADIIQVEFFAVRLTDGGLEPIRVLPQLRFLFVANTKITDASMEVIGASPRLEGVDLDGTRVTDAGLKHLKGLTSLKWLGIRGNRVTDAGLEQLGGLTGLESLGLRGTQVTDEGVKKLQQELPNCKMVR
jgi:hypothetical protein